MTRPPAAAVALKIVVNVAMSGFGTSLAKLTQAILSPLAKLQTAAVLPSAPLASDGVPESVPVIEPESTLASTSEVEPASNPESEPWIDVAASKPESTPPLDPPSEKPGELEPHPARAEATTANARYD